MQVYIHYLGEHPDGPIRTTRKDVHQDGHTATVCRGGSFAVACQPQRRHLAVVGRQGRKLVVREAFFATGDPQAVTCPLCHQAPLFLRDAPGAVVKALAAQKAG